MRSKFINFNEILSRGAFMNVIISPRGPGKSWAAKERSLEKFFDSGEQFMYVRRTLDELNTSKGVHFDDILEQKYRGKYEMKTKGFQYMIREAAPPELEGAELNEFREENPWEVCGYAVAVSSQQSYKSAAFPRVTTIYYDEFLPENEWARINPREVEQFSSLIGTVTRGRKDKVKIFMLSNTGFLNNPYFKLWNVKSSDFANREFLIRENGNVCIWFYEFDEQEVQEALDDIPSRVFGAAYTGYAVHGDFKDGGGHQVIDDPGNKKLRFIMNGDRPQQSFQAWSHEEGYWVRKGKASDRVPNFLFSEWQRGGEGIYDPKMIRNVRGVMQRRNLFFDSQDTRAEFLALLRKGR